MTDDDRENIRKHFVRIAAGQPSDRWKVVREDDDERTQVLSAEDVSMIRTEARLRTASDRQFYGPGAEAARSRVRSSSEVKTVEAGGSSHVQPAEGQPTRRERLLDRLTAALDRIAGRKP